MSAAMPPEMPVLRTVLKCLLAFMLCVNGFGMPVAMAHAGPSNGDAPAESSDAPCHEVESVDTAAGKQQSPSHDSSCCSNGQCFCTCIATAVLTVPVLPPMLQMATAGNLPIDILAFPAAHFAVLQRPPIV